MKILQNTDWEGIARLVLDSDRTYRSKEKILRIAKQKYPGSSITEKDVEEILREGESWITNLLGERNIH